MHNFILKLTQNQKRVVVFIHDSFMALISFPLSLSLRFGTLDHGQFELNSFWDLVIIVFIAKIVSLILFKLSRGIWRFSSTQDLMLILKANSFALGTSLLAIFLWNRLELIPRSVFVIDWIIFSGMLGSGRFFYRVWLEDKNRNRNVKRTLLIGAGEAGEQLIREIKRDENSENRIVGIVDDNPKQHNRTIHGIPILGNTNQIKELAIKYEIVAAFIAIPSASGKEIRRIVKICSEEKLQVKTLPALRDIAKGKVTVSLLKSVNIEDLLGRRPVKLNSQALGKLLQKKSIMVTGAGGSIGHELCLQIAKFDPNKLILFENNEYNLYQIELTLLEQFPTIDIVAVIGDIRDRSKVRSTIKKQRPQLLFHAAAYKHVPMMESNSTEAVKTNVAGTQIVAQEASELAVERFVMVSTDKAVNPTNVMGATKRITEMICQQLQERENNGTKFSIVRFGNVLGSAGSVIPRFEKQIKKGGPITITHPEITRYFMSIPEATQLILQAGCLGDGGEIFVLDMGKPVKIVDLAQDLIRLSGLTPDDIEIKFIGLRAGEKLYEELLVQEENTLETAHPLVRVARARKIPTNLTALIQHLLDCPDLSSPVVAALKNIVPEYTPRSINDNGKISTLRSS